MSQMSHHFTRQDPAELWDSEPRFLANLSHGTLGARLLGMNAGMTPHPRAPGRSKRFL